MSEKCGQCGAGNNDGARRCRVCANLLNPSAPEVEHRPPELPDHVQRRIDEAVAPHALGDTYIPQPNPEGYVLPPRPREGDSSPVFDSDALFRDMGPKDRFEHLPPPPTTQVSDELVMPPEPERVDLLNLIDIGPEASSEQIEQAAAKAVREERLRRRPGFLNKVFKSDDEDDRDPGSASF